jgi:Domain of unknown function (DUF4349)
LCAADLAALSAHLFSARMRPRICVLSLAAALILSGACSGDKVDVTRAERSLLVSGKAQTPAAAAPGASVAAYWAAQKLIRSAEVHLEVKDVQMAMRSVDSIVRQRGALLADSRMSKDADDQHLAELVIRVPSEHFTEMLVALRQVGSIKSEAVKTQDVTKEYADLETRLAVKEQTVTRLRSLLEGRTAKLADVLEVERELARAVTELETMKGERRFYDQQIAVSSISVSLFDHESSHAVQFAGPVASALRSSLGVLARSLSGLIYAVAFLLPWAVLFALLWWPVTRLRRYLRGVPGEPTPRSTPPKP